jgi:hypothetical protein
LQAVVLKQHPGCREQAHDHALFKLKAGDLPSAAGLQDHEHKRREEETGCNGVESRKPRSEAGQELALHQTECLDDWETETPEKIRNQQHQDCLIVLR